MARAPDSSSMGNVTTPSFHAPPLVVANIAVYSLLVAGALILLGFTFRAVFYARKRTIGAATVVALIVAIIAYAFDIAILLIEVKNLDTLSSTPDSLSPLRSAEIILSSFINPTLFVAIALVIQNRFCSVSTSGSRFIAFTRTAGFILVIMTTFDVAGAGIYASAYAEMRKVNFGAFHRRLFISNILFYAATAFQILGTIFLATSAFLVKARTKSDQIMSLTLFVVIPLLSLYSLAAIIFDVIIVRLPLPGSEAGDIQRNNAMNLSITVVYGVLRIAIMSTLVSLISSTRLWNSQYGEREGTSLAPRKHVTQDASHA